MGAQDIIAIGVAATALALVVRMMYRQMRAGGCGGACHCSHADHSALGENAPPRESRSLKRTPLVALGQGEARANPVESRDPR